jgi:hypothetical protein
MKKASGHIPIRTCISCGMKRAKGDMVRLVIDEGGFLFRDYLGREKGRGAYVCDRKECGEDLLKKKRLQRVFRREKPVIMADPSQDDKLFSGKTKEFRDQDG